jgi:hypothetical protein
MRNFESRFAFKVAEAEVHQQMDGILEPSRVTLRKSPRVNKGIPPLRFGNRIPYKNVCAK